MIQCLNTCSSTEITSLPLSTVSRLMRRASLISASTCMHKRTADMDKWSKMNMDNQLKLQYYWSIYLSLNSHHGIDKHISNKEKGHYGTNLCQQKFSCPSNHEPFGHEKLRSPPKWWHLMHWPNKNKWSVIWVIRGVQASWTIITRWVGVGVECWGLRSQGSHCYANQGSMTPFITCIVPLYVTYDRPKKVHHFLHPLLLYHM